MNVTKDNFLSILPQLAEEIKTATYMSVDFEMTGLFLQKNQDRQIDSVEERYSKMIYGIDAGLRTLQFGLTLSHYNENTQEIVHTPYNIYTFPSSQNYFNSSQPVNQSSVILNVEAIEFNKQHGMDFQTWVTQGVTYVSRKDSQEIIDAENNAYERNANYAKCETINDFKDSLNKQPQKLRAYEQELCASYTKLVQHFLFAELLQKGVIDEEKYEALIEKFQSNSNTSNSENNSGRRRKWGKKWNNNNNNNNNKNQAKTGDVDKVEQSEIPTEVILGAPAATESNNDSETIPVFEAAPTEISPVGEESSAAPTIEVVVVVDSTETVHVDPIETTKTNKVETTPPPTTAWSSTTTFELGEDTIQSRSGLLLQIELSLWKLSREFGLIIRIKNFKNPTTNKRGITVYIDTKESYAEYLEQCKETYRNHRLNMTGITYIWQLMTNSLQTEMNTENDKHHIGASCPIIVHNGLFDLLFLYNQCEGKLPPTFGEFSTLLQRYFPKGVYDTKFTFLHPITASITSQLKGVSSHLGGIFNWFSQQQNKQKEKLEQIQSPQLSPDVPQITSTPSTPSKSSTPSTPSTPSAPLSPEPTKFQRDKKNNKPSTPVPELYVTHTFQDGFNTYVSDLDRCHEAGYDSWITSVVFGQLLVFISSHELFQVELSKALNIPIQFEGKNGKGDQNGENDQNDQNDQNGEKRPIQLKTNVINIMLNSQFFQNVYRSRINAVNLAVCFDCGYQLPNKIEKNPINSVLYHNTTFTPQNRRMDDYIVIMDIEKAYNQLLSHGHLTDIHSSPDDKKKTIWAISNKTVIKKALEQYFIRLLAQNGTPIDPDDDSTIPFVDIFSYYNLTKDDNQMVMHLKLTPGSMMVNHLFKYTPLVETPSNTNKIGHTMEGKTFAWERGNLFEAWVLKEHLIRALRDYVVPEVKSPKAQQYVEPYYLDKISLDCFYAQSFEHFLQYRDAAQITAVSTVIDKNVYPFVNLSQIWNSENKHMLEMIIPAVVTSSKCELNESNENQSGVGFGQVLSDLTGSASQFVVGVLTGLTAVGISFLVSKYQNAPR